MQIKTPDQARALDLRTEEERKREAKRERDRKYRAKKRAEKEAAKPLLERATVAATEMALDLETHEISPDAAFARGRSETPVAQAFDSMVQTVAQEVGIPEAILRGEAMERMEAEDPELAREIQPEADKSVADGFQIARKDLPPTLQHLMTVIEATPEQVLREEWPSMADGRPLPEDSKLADGVAGLVLGVAFGILPTPQGPVRYHPMRAAIRLHQEYLDHKAQRKERNKAAKKQAQARRKARKAERKNRKRNR